MTLPLLQIVSRNQCVTVWTLKVVKVSLWCFRDTNLWVLPLDFSPVTDISAPFLTLAEALPPTTSRSREPWSEHNVVFVIYRENLLRSTCQRRDDFFRFLCFSTELGHIRLPRVNLVCPCCSRCSWLQVLFALKPYPISSINSELIFFFFNDPLHIGHHFFIEGG